MSELWLASLIVLWMVTLFLAFLMAGALRQIGIISLRLGADPGPLITREGLDRGSQAPNFRLAEAVSNQIIELNQLPLERRVLVFLSTSCISCRDLIPHLNEVMATRGREFDFLAISQGTRPSVEAFAAETGIKSPILVDPSGQTAASYDVSMTPFAFVLDRSGRVAIRGVVNTWLQLDALLDEEGTVEPEIHVEADPRPSAMGAHDG